MSQNDRLPTADASTAAKPLTFTFNGQTLPRLRRRHAGLGAARQRRRHRRAQLEVSPSARHRRGGCRRAERGGAARRPARTRCRTCARREVELYQGLVATSVNGWPSIENDCMAVNRQVRALHSGGLLLQDLHVAAQAFWHDVREVHPRRRAVSGRRRPSTTRTATTSATRTATCWWSAAARPVSARALAAGAVGRARDPGRRAGGTRRLRCCRAAREHRRQAGAAMGGAASMPNCAACPTCSCCRAPPRSATTTTTS